MSDKLTIGYDSMPAEHHAYYDPEGLVGRGKSREDAVADLLEQTDEAWATALAERDAARRALSDAVIRADNATAALDYMREALYPFVVKEAGPKPVPLERLAALVVAKLNDGGPYAEKFARELVEVSTAHACIDNDDGKGPQMGPPWAKTMCWSCDVEELGDGPVTHKATCVAGLAEAYLAALSKNSNAGDADKTRDAGDCIPRSVASSAAEPAPHAEYTALLYRALDTMVKTWDEDDQVAFCGIAIPAAKAALATNPNPSDPARGSVTTTAINNEASVLHRPEASGSVGLGPFVLDDEQWEEFVQHMENPFAGMTQEQIAEHRAKWERVSKAMQEYREKKAAAKSLPGVGNAPTRAYLNDALAEMDRIYAAKGAESALVFIRVAICECPKPTAEDIERAIAGYSQGGSEYRSREEQLEHALRTLLAVVDGGEEAEAFPGHHKAYAEQVAIPRARAALKP